MKLLSYLSLIPIFARVRRRQNRMTRLCIIFAVFLVTAVFSMADMDIRMEQARLTEKHAQEFTFEAIMDTAMAQNLFLLAGILFILNLLVRRKMLNLLRREPEFLINEIEDGHQHRHVNRYVDSRYRNGTCTRSH